MTSGPSPYVLSDALPPLTRREAHHTVLASYKQLLAPTSGRGRPSGRRGLLLALRQWAATWARRRKA